MAKLVDSGLLVCDDCTMAIGNGDYDGMDSETETRVKTGIVRLSKIGYPVIGEEYGFKWSSCQCCGGRAGNRHECSLLGG